MTREPVALPAPARHLAALIVTLGALPRGVKLAGGAAIGFVALVAAGVPLAVLAPFAGPAACLGMMLLMGHGMHGGHGGGDRG